MSMVEDLLAHGDRFLDELDVIEAVDALSPDELGDLAVGLVVMADRLSARAGVVAAEAGSLGAHERDGSTSITAHVTHRVDTARGRVSRQVSTGRFLRGHDVIAQAARSGSISSAHVDVLGKAAKSSDAAVVSMLDPDTQSVLVGYADDFEFAQWCLLIKHWELVTDPDGREKKAAKAHNDRDVWLYPNFARAGYSGEIHLGNLQGARVREAIDRYADQLFEADLAETREQLGRDPSRAEMPRDRRTLRADAFIELIQTGIDACPALTTVLPLVNIHIDHDSFTAGLDWLAGHDDAYTDTDLTTMVCETIDGHAITPTEAIQAAFEGHIRRIVYGTESETIDFGRKKRLFTGAAREAALQTGRWCQHPGCRRPPRWCQVDHITAWQNGGTTNQTNAQTLCGYHNRWKYTHHDRQHPNTA